MVPMHGGKVSALTDLHVKTPMDCSHCEAVDGTSLSDSSAELHYQHECHLLKVKEDISRKRDLGHIKESHQVCVPVDTNTNFTLNNTKLEIMGESEDDCAVDILLEEALQEGLTEDTSANAVVKVNLLNKTEHEVELLLADAQLDDDTNNETEEETVNIIKNNPSPNTLICDALKDP